MIEVPDADAMMRLGGRLADAVSGHLAAKLAAGAVIINLTGELGAGKTTLARGFLRRLGVTASVRSPTYTLVEPYKTRWAMVFHLDLYRVADPDELEFLGLRDMLDPGSVVLVEWPERGVGLLPPATLDVRIAYRASGRAVTLVADTGDGPAIRSAFDTMVQT